MPYRYAPRLMYKFWFSHTYHAATFCLWTPGALHVSVSPWYAKVPREFLLLVKVTGRIVEVALGAEPTLAYSLVPLVSISSTSCPSTIWNWPAEVASEMMARPGEALSGEVCKYLWKFGAATARIQV